MTTAPTNAELIKQVIKMDHTRVTYKNHGYDPETVRFILVAYRSKNLATMLGDVRDWGMSLLTINEYDYDTPGTFSAGIWVIGGRQELVMFTLKYSYYIVLEVTSERMEQLMIYARLRIMKRPSTIKRKDGVDYMAALSKTTPINRAIREYRGLTSWYAYYV